MKAHSIQTWRRLSTPALQAILAQRTARAAWTQIMACHALPFCDTVDVQVLNGAGHVPRGSPLPPVAAAGPRSGRIPAGVGRLAGCQRRQDQLLPALIEKGHVKFDNFRRNPDKRHYAYLLTPTGVEAKAWATVQFLRRKRAEYETIRAEIEALQSELAQQSSPPVVETNAGANATESAIERGP
jgi:hypothetical protein